jgi:hypothetical protein
VKKAEKVVARVSKATVKTKVPRLVTAGASPKKAVASKPRVKVQKSTATPAVSKSTLAKSAAVKPKASVARKPASKSAKSTGSKKDELSKTPDSTIKA